MPISKRSAKRRAKLAKQALTSEPMARRDVSAEIASIFFTPLEPLTDALMAELAQRGWEADKLREAAQLRWKYNRVRDSLMADDDWLEWEGSGGC